MPPAGYSVLDPSLKLLDGKLRVWHGYTQGMDHSKSKITTGYLSLGDTSTKVSAEKSTKSKKEVTCIKGKKVKQFKGKCPKGYTKK